ncbi:receptor [Selenomonas sp. oral taxon 126]|uniref:TonB-dependent receptor plug domain-containing protein n=1 Tax=Selenomonas sp. oral taxon 126 TaxID=712528 RepID=UPI0008077930|nr:TonB-dependent receptor [Selenomonas sp. oral taxon 126]ANR70935.1 receptor [Selenomonas sp. oral taxon 126]
MSHKHTRKSILLTAAVLSTVTVPACAAARDGGTSVVTDKVIVTASRTEQEVKETPSAVEVITRADIDKMGAESLAQALKLALGIDIQENAMVGNRSALRGMNTNQTLILIDGRRVRTENTSETMNYYELQRVNMDDVERIEIVRGAVSSLYGSEALGGVINVIRKRPAEAQTSVTLDWTTRQNDQGLRLDSGKVGKWAFSTSFKHIGVRERGTDSISNMYGKKYFFNIDGRMEITKDKHLDVFFDYLKEDLDMKDSATQKTTYDHDRITTGAKYSGRDNRGDYEMQVYYTYFDKNQRTRKRADSALSSFDDMTYNSLIFDGRRSIQLAPNHLMTVGGEYRKEDYESTRIKGSMTTTLEGVTNQLGDSSMDFAALYVQDEWLASPRWTIIPSVRWDHSDVFGSEVTGKLGTTYKINKGLRFKANVGSAYRAPTASELYFDWRHTPARKINVHIVGNPDLKPEKALNFDLGIEGERGKTFGKLTYFHNKVEDLINVNVVNTVIPGPPPPAILSTGTYQNIDSATIQGVELEAKQDLGSGFALRGLYTYLDAQDDKTNTRLTGRARHKASLQLSYDDQRHGWNATLWQDWTAGYRYAEQVGRRTVYKDAALALTNFVVTKKFNEQFSAYLGVDNIFDKESDALAYDGRIWRGGVRMTF